MISNRLKIAIFHLAFVYSGGGEKLVLKEAELLRARGHTVDVFVPVINKEKSFPDLMGRYEINSFLPQFKFGSWQYESFQIILTCILAPLFAYKFKKYDVILAANQPSLWIAYIIKKLFKVPYVSYLAQPTRFLYPRAIDKETGLFFVKKESSSYSVKLMTLFKKFVSWADRVSVINSDQILSNGEYMKERLKEIYRVGNIISCPSGTDTIRSVLSMRTRLKGDVRVNGKKIEKPFILITNRHFSQKRFEHGVVAFSSVLNKYPNYSLVITGESTEYTKEVGFLIQRLGLIKKVVFTGYVPEKKLNALYSNAVVYLYTAPEEDFGMGIVEAMGNGTPVVAWKNAGPGFSVLNGQTGLLAKPFEVGDFSDKLEILVSDMKKNSVFGKNALNHVRQNYSWGKHVRCLEQSLEKVSIK